MATLQDLFKKQKSDLYSTDKIRIDSLGLINPPRQAALLLASPNAIGDLIGSAGGALLGGNANRPSDTIFKNNNLLKPSVNIKNNKNELDNNHCNQSNQDYSSEYSYKDNKIP
jgi:hypothetical protein